MSTETTTLRAVLKDELSRPARRLRGEVDSTVNSLQRLARTDASTPLGRLSRSVGHAGLAFHRLDPTLRRVSDGLVSGIARGTRLAAIGMGALTAATTTFGLSTASQFEQTRISFDGFLGSAAAGKQLFGEMQALNLQTPFQLPAITGGAKQLLGFGFGQSEITPLMKAATDVGAGLGGTSEVLDRILLNLGQVHSLGKVTGRELRDFAVLGVPGYELTASILGKTREEIAKMGDDAEVSSDQFIKAFIGMQGPMAHFAGMAEQQMGSLAGQWSNFMDVLNVRLADESAPLVTELKTLLPVLTDAVGGLIDAAGPPLFRVVGLIAEGVTRVLPMVAPLLTAFATGLENIARVAGGPLLAALEPVAGELGLAITEFFIALVPVLPELTEAFVGFVRILPAAVVLLGRLLSMSQPMIGFIDNLLGFGPVKTVAAGLLLTLTGYKILGPLGKLGFMFAASLFRIAQGQMAVAAASATATAALATTGAAAKKPSLLSKVGKAMIPLAVGMEIGNWLKNDTPVGGAVVRAGLGVRSAVGLDTPSHNDAMIRLGLRPDRVAEERAAKTDAFNQRYGIGAYKGMGTYSATYDFDITVNNPGSNVDVEVAVRDALTAIERDRYERGDER